MFSRFIRIISIFVFFATHYALFAALTDQEMAQINQETENFFQNEWQTLEKSLNQDCLDGISADKILEEIAQEQAAEDRATSISLQSLWTPRCNLFSIDLNQDADNTDPANKQEVFTQKLRFQTGIRKQDVYGCATHLLKMIPDTMLAQYVKTKRIDFITKKICDDAQNLLKAFKEEKEAVKAKKRWFKKKKEPLKIYLDKNHRYIGRNPFRLASLIPNLGREAIEKVFPDFEVHNPHGCPSNYVYEKDDKGNPRPCAVTSPIPDLFCNNQNEEDEEQPEVDHWDRFENPEYRELNHFISPTIIFKVLTIPFSPLRHSPGIWLKNVCFPKINQFTKRLLIPWFLKPFLLKHYQQRYPNVPDKDAKEKVKDIITKMHVGLGHFVHFMIGHWTLNTFDQILHFRWSHHARSKNKLFIELLERYETAKNNKKHKALETVTTEIREFVEQGHGGKRWKSF